MKIKKPVLIFIIIAVLAAIAALWFIKRGECREKCNNDPSDWTLESCMSNCLQEDR